MDTCVEIKTFPLNREGLEVLEEQGKLSKLNWSTNWPIIYVLSNSEEAYVGETYKVGERIKQHQKNPERLTLTRIYILIDEQANKSYTLDIESSLIRYMASDGTFKLQNGNKGLISYGYFNKPTYQKRFRDIIWPKFQELKLARRDLKEIENDDLFKYSPYTPLAINQYEIVSEILKDLSQDHDKPLSVIINGSAGTGKTVLGTYLMKLLNSKDETFEKEETKQDLTKIQDKIKKIGLVIPQQSLRQTLKRVFRNVKGLNSKMVISPNEVVKDEYDLLIVDEAHRLRRRKNLSIGGYNYFKKNNELLNLTKESTELEWILAKSKYQIFFYDKTQSIKPTDITPEHFVSQLKDNELIEHTLFSQFRVQAGEDYIEYIKDLLNSKLSQKKSFGDYEFKLFDDIQLMKEEIIGKEKEHKLCRLLAGYGWKWKTKTKKATHDIDVNEKTFIWNTKSKDWINSKNSINEVGCIHTIQGYDLNYAGVIFGPEIIYDEKEKKIKIIKENYHDVNGKKGISDDELEEYIKNIYSVLLTRGIKGTYVYVCDDKLREYFRKFIES